MRKRAGALIIKHHKLLLISEDNQEHFWTPGGGLEVGENFVQALARELMEELNIKLLSSSIYHEVKEKEEDVRYFLAKTTEIPELKLGTKIIWLGISGLESGKITMSPRVQNIVLPKLIHDGLVK